MHLDTKKTEHLNGRKGDVSGFEHDMVVDAR